MKATLGQTVVVVGSGAERITKRVSEELPDRPVDFVEQPPGKAPNGEVINEPWYEVRYDFVLQKNH